MKDLSYTLSSALKESLQKIEVLHRQILLTPISPKTEQRLKWEATLARIHWSLLLSSNPINKNEVVKLLSSQTKKKLTPEEEQVINYRQALSYIRQEWLASGSPVTAKAVLSLFEITTGQKAEGFRLVEGSLKPFLEYIQVGSESPIIQAGIAQIQLLSLKLFEDGNGRVARLLALLFLYKHGYDFRGLLVLEEHWRHDLVSFKEATDKALNEGNLTFWLEYFVKGMLIQLEKAQSILSSSRFHTDLPQSFFDLDNRQKNVLTLLEEPGATMTNREFQKLFKVSQITASRSLAKLASLGLLFPHGKGRSVYYTRV